MSTSTSVDSHVRVKGITPKVKIIDWGSRITLRIEVGEASMTWYLSPLTDEAIGDYTQRVIDALGEVKIDSASAEN